jgi:uncharacterized protein (DUF4415 family)
MKKARPKAGKSAGKKTGRGKINLRASAEEWAAPDEKMYKPIKKPITLRIDADILSWFKGQRRGYQTRINRALRAVMTKERKAAG